MSRCYTKLFQKILDSTIWLEDDETRLVWITLLAMTDQDGIVDAPIPSIANRARVSLQCCEVAMAKFQEPDPHSRTKDHEGRRIKQVDGGWLVLNHRKYRDMMSLEHRREYKATKEREYRARDKKPKKMRGASGPSGGETAYVKALENGASQETLDAMVDGRL